MKWIRSNGGPFIVLPWEHRRQWEGADPPSDSRVVKAEFRWDDEANPATDYDEACDKTEAPHWFGLVKRQDFTALALPMYEKTWAPRPHGGIIVHCDTAPSHQHAVKLVRDQLGPRVRDEPVKWKRTRLRLPIPDGKLVICDAAYAGASQPRKMQLVIELARGTYAIATADYKPDDETLMTLYRLTREPGDSRSLRRAGTRP
jgi:hypothetical protein